MELPTSLTSVCHLHHPITLTMLCLTVISQDGNSCVNICNDDIPVNQNISVRQTLSKGCNAHVLHSGVSMLLRDRESLWCS